MSATAGTDELLPRQTSVPSWPAVAPALDPSGTSWVLVGIGSQARADVETWAAQAAGLGGPRHVLHLTGIEAGTDAGARSQLAAVLASTRVGARVAVSGDEADVLALASWLRREGVMSEEVTLHAVSRTQLTVFCVHCETTHRVAGDAEATTCPSCARSLELHEHVSGHRGTYLGVQP